MNDFRLLVGSSFFFWGGGGLIEVSFLYGAGEEHSVKVNVCFLNRLIFFFNR